MLDVVSGRDAAFKSRRIRIFNAFKRGDIMVQTQQLKDSRYQKSMKLWFIPILLLCLCIQVAVHAQPPDFSWVASAGGSDRDVLWDLAVDSDGNCYGVGSFEGTADFDGTDVVSAGGTDAYIAKYDDSGSLIWVRRFGSSDSDETKCIAIDGDGNLLVGGVFKGSVDFDTAILSGGTWLSIFILKMNPDGNVLWARKAGGSGIDSVQDIAVDEMDNLYLTGGFYSDTAQFGTITVTNLNNQNTYVAKYNTSGDVQWAKGYGGGIFSSGYAITVDPSGYLRVTGRFRDKIVFDQTTLNSAGDFDGFIIKQNQDGTVLWAKGFGGEDNETMHGIASDNQGNCVVVGFFGHYGHAASLNGITLNPVSDNDDILVAKYDKSGNAIWAKAAGGPYFDVAYDVHMDASGNSYVSGRFKDTAIFGATTLTSAGEMDVVVVKYDSGGNIVWTKQAGGSDSDYGQAVGTDSDDNVLVGGIFKLSADFDLLTADSEGDDDLFIAKLIQPPTGIPSVPVVMPTTAILFQNYPNPFNRSTRISYSLPAAGLVTLTIHDILGNEVQTLVHAYQQADSYSISLDASALNSGIYFYRLKVGNDFIETKKLIYIK